MTRASPQSPTIGERLKKEREKRGLSLEEVHSRLRIHPGVLSKLEENEFAALPAAIYTRGFLRRYGQFLELDADELLSEYENLNLAQRPPVTAPEGSLASGGGIHLPPVRNPGQPPPAAAVGRLKAGALVLLLAGTTVWLLGAALKMTRSHSGAPRLLGRQAGVTAPRQAPAPAAKTAAAVKYAPPAAGRRINTPALNNFPKISARDSIILSIAARTDAWLRVVADGAVLFEEILPPGESRRWTAKSGFEVTFGRPAAVDLKVNGFPIGPPDGGQAKNIAIDRSGISRLR